MNNMNLKKTLNCARVKEKKHDFFFQNPSYVILMINISEFRFQVHYSIYPVDFITMFVLLSHFREHRDS